MRAQHQKSTALASPEEDDGDETVSLSDMPLLGNSAAAEFSTDTPEAMGWPKLEEEFEFQTPPPSASGKNPWKVDESSMSVADELFFQGRMLPLISSLRPCSSLSSSSEGILGLDSRSSSVGGSNSSISRSHLTASSSATRDSSMWRCNNFYSCPSPKLQLLTRKAANHVPRRRSTSSFHGAAHSGWGLFLLRTPPEMELQFELKQRKASGGCMGGSKRYVKADFAGSVKKESAKEEGESSIVRKLRKRFGCKCSRQEAVEPSGKRTEEKGSVSHKRQGAGGEGRCLSSRTFQWLEELPLTKQLVQL